MRGRSKAAGEWPQQPSTRQVLHHRDQPAKFRLEWKRGDTTQNRPVMNNTNGGSRVSGRAWTCFGLLFAVILFDPRLPPGANPELQAVSPAEVRGPQFARQLAFCQCILVSEGDPKKETGRLRHAKAKLKLAESSFDVLSAAVRSGAAGSPTSVTSGHATDRIPSGRNAC
jgi:hypothetical protein